MENVKLNVGTFLIETTRRCNMSCAHCLRGASEDVGNDVNFEELFRDVEQIETLVFTGGEPSLPEGVAVMNKTLDACERHGILVYGFYIVTNGKEVSRPFLEVCMKWYAYVLKHAYEPKMSGLALSADKYHEPIDERNVNLLKCFSFFREEDKKIDFDKGVLINEGKARLLSTLNKRSLPSTAFDMLEGDGDDYVEFIQNGETSYLILNDLDVYISINGEVRLNCDRAYVNTADTIGSVRNRSLKEILSSYGPEIEKTRALYREIHAKICEADVGDVCIPLKSGRRIVIQKMFVGDQPEFKAVGITRALQVTLWDESHGELAASYTMDVKDVSHAARLALNFVLDFNEELK